MGITMEQITFQLGNPIDQLVYIYPINIGGKTMTRGSCKGILFDFIPSLSHMPNLLPERSVKTAPGIPEVTLFLHVFAKDALATLLNGDADAMWVYADQAKNYQCSEGVTANWDCDLWVARHSSCIDGPFNWMICL